MEDNNLIRDLIRLQEAMRKFCVWLLRDKPCVLKDLCLDVVHDAWVDLVSKFGKETASREVTADGRLKAEAEKAVRNALRREVRRQRREEQLSDQKLSEMSDPKDTSTAIETFCQKVIKQMPLERQQAIDLLMTGHKQREVAERVHVRPRTLRYWVKALKTQLLRGV